MWFIAAKDIQQNNRYTTEFILKPDSLIFDMDGTLWDAVDTYVIAWNNALRAKGYAHEVTREDLLSLMGKEVLKILANLFPDASPHVLQLLAEEVDIQYKKLMPHMKPIIFPGVQSGLEKLSEKYKLFMLSNCEKDSLPNFMRHTKTTHLFIDYMEHGMNFQPKSVNLQLLKAKHDLQTPVYIGDTDHDSAQCRIARVPFVFVTYGFGKTDCYTLKFDSFDELTTYFLNI